MISTIPTNKKVPAANDVKQDDTMSANLESKIVWSAMPSKTANGVMEEKSRESLVTNRVTYLNNGQEMAIISGVMMSDVIVRGVMAM